MAEKQREDLRERCGSLGFICSRVWRSHRGNEAEGGEGLNGSDLC